MREITTDVIIDEVKRMCIESNYYLSTDIYQSMQKKSQSDASPIARSILKDLVKNADLAREKEVPICQDTGMVVVFVEVGQEVHINGGSLREAINEGVRQGYEEGYLRKSVVSDPFIRENTRDNTPAIIHFDIVEGNHLKISLAPKGFGSENMSRMAMLKPSDGIEGVRDFVLETVEKAGPNPCPPIVVGVGVGGTIDQAAKIAKKALLRPIDEYSELEHISGLERDLERDINNLGIGPQGLGGETTTLGVNINIYPTHIAGLPVVVNINCHATRHQEVIL